MKCSEALRILLSHGGIEISQKGLQKKIFKQAGIKK